MKKLLPLLVTILIVLMVLSGCTGSKAKLNGVIESTQFEIMVRESYQDEYTVVTDEVIKNNILYLLKENISQDKIDNSKNQDISAFDNGEIIITSTKGEEYIIGFPIYYVSEFVDGGPVVMSVDSGKKKRDFYYNKYNLNDLIPIAITGSRTFSGEVTEIQPIRVQSPIFGSITLGNENLPENIEIGSEVEITLGKMTETSKGLYAESIIKK